MNPFNAAESLDPDAAAALADYMSELSEDCWAAGWLSGCEFSLWRMATQPDNVHSWGMGSVFSEDVQRLRELSEKCGGWIVWDDTPGEKWVSLSDWAPKFAAYEAELAHYQPVLR